MKTPRLANFVHMNKLANPEKGVRLHLDSHGGLYLSKRRHRVTEFIVRKAARFLKMFSSKDFHSKFRLNDEMRSAAASAKFDLLLKDSQRDVVAELIDHRKLNIAANSVELPQNAQNFVNYRLDMDSDPPSSQTVLEFLSGIGINVETFQDSTEREQFARVFNKMAEHVYSGDNKSISPEKFAVQMRMFAPPLRAMAANPGLADRIEAYNANITHGLWTMQKKYQSGDSSDLAVCMLRLCCEHNGFMNDCNYFVRDPAQDNTDHVVGMFRIAVRTALSSLRAQNINIEQLDSFLSALQYPYTRDVVSSAYRCVNNLTEEQAASFTMDKTVNEYKNNTGGLPLKSLIDTRILQKVEPLAFYNFTDTKANIPIQTSIAVPDLVSRAVSDYINTRLTENPAKLRFPQATD